MNGAFVIALLVHICSSCSSKAQGFTFKDDEPKSLSSKTVEIEPVAVESKLQEISSDNYFKSADENEASRREGKEIERIDLEETVEDEPPRFPRKISVSSKTVDEEVGKIQFTLFSNKVKYKISVQNVYILNLI